MKHHMNKKYHLSLGSFRGIQIKISLVGGLLGAQKSAKGVQLIFFSILGFFKGVSDGAGIRLLTCVR